MTIQDLSKIIRELISSNEESVQLPGFGSFIVVDTPSQIINDGRAITPPSRKIIFESSSDANDPYFTEKYAKLAGISLKTAKGEVAEFLSGLKRELVEKTKVEIPQFGTICFGEKGSFVFEAEVAFDFEADSYCLETIPLKPRGTAEPASTPQKEQEQPLEILDIELVDEQADEQAAEQAAAVTETEQDAAEAKQEPTEVTESPEASEVTEVADEAEAAEEAEIAPEVAPEVAPAGVPAGDEQKVAENLSGHNRRWVLWSVLVAVGVLILLIVLMVLFKEQLKPLLELLLYSKEELEILHQVNI